MRMLLLGAFCSFFISGMETSNIKSGIAFLKDKNGLKELFLNQNNEIECDCEFPPSKFALDCIACFINDNTSGVKKVSLRIPVQNMAPKQRKEYQSMLEKKRFKIFKEEESDIFCFFDDSFMQELQEAKSTILKDLKEIKNLESPMLQANPYKKPYKKRPKKNSKRTKK